MENEQTPQEKAKSLKTWLDETQQESWQLELISGVVIFLMLGAHETIQGLNDRVMVGILTGNELRMLVASAYAILSIAYYALLLTFLLHLILRGLWIGAIGLRSVSGDFEYEVLDYQPRFTNWLQKRMGAFDDYIERLEMQYSLAFSFAFLIFFSAISIGTFIITIAAITIGTGWLVKLNNTQDPATWQILITAGANLFMAFIGLIYLIDFSSLGWFKKKKILQKVYFPFYRFMGWVTFARFYRPFYYNLIAPFGRKLVKRMWIVVLRALIIISIVRYDYFPTENKGQSIIHLRLRPLFY
jgi:hypothetical protein